MTKQTPTTLEQTIAAALANSQIASETLYELIAATESGITEAEAAAKSEHEKSLDPVLSPDPVAALRARELAEVVAARLRASLPRLHAHLESALDSERRARYSAGFERLRSAHAAAAQKFKRVPALIDELVALFTEAQRVDFQVQDLHITAPPSEPRRLSPIMKPVRLEFDGQAVWPPKPAPVDLSGYRPDDRQHQHDCSPDWWKPGAASAEAAARREAAELREVAAARRRFYGQVNGV